MTHAGANRLQGAIARLEIGERAAAAELLREDLRLGPADGEQWSGAQQLASAIGEIETAIEAARRFSRTPPIALDRVLRYCRVLAEYGRVEEALSEIGRMPAPLREHPAALLFLGGRALEDGEFRQAEQYYRRAITEAPLQAWSGLAAAKSFVPDDPDLLAMERLLPRIGTADPALQARFLFGVANAYHDCGEFDRAWALYEKGAALRKRMEPWEPDRHQRFSEALIRQFTAEARQRLTPVAEPHRHALFVTGLPRSGTTLVEQILTGHSQVADGAEFNLLRASLIPTLDYSLEGAMRYQHGFEDCDPWGKLAADYFRMLEMRFRTKRLIVDKSPLQSHFMGLLLHMLPRARVVWLRRDPEDTALSCFRTFFSTPIAWTWSFEDIGRFFRVEDRLFAHWIEQFPERILAVSYEDLVREPDRWLPKIVEFAGLPMEPRVLEPHRNRRRVRTASLRQVRGPISPSRIGAADAYSRHMGPFRKAYAG